jgi:hypothetical protein
MKLALAGDTMLGRGVAERLETASPEALFSSEVVEVARSADLFVLNLECCISTRGAPSGLPASSSSSAHLPERSTSFVIWASTA